MNKSVYTIHDILTYEEYDSQFIPILERLLLLFQGLTINPMENDKGSDDYAHHRVYGKTLKNGKHHNGQPFREEV